MKWSLRTKIIAIVVVAGILPLALSLIALGIFGYRHLIATEGAAYEREAAHISLTLQRILERDIQHLTGLIAMGEIPQWVERIQAGSPDPSLAQVSELDSRWAELAADSPEVIRATQNELADKLRELQTSHPLFVEIIVADSKGRLIAATGKPSDYDQSDESWWQITRKFPSKAARLEGLEFDQSSQTFSLDLALPLRLQDSSAPYVGVIKVVIDASALFASLSVQSPDFDAEVQIVNREGRVLLELANERYIPDQATISQAATSHFAQKRAGWFLGSLHGGDRQMVGFAPFALLGNYPVNLRANGEPLYVVISNRASLVLMPLRQQIISVALAGILLICACGSIALYLAQQNVIRPLITLRQATGALAETTGSTIDKLSSPAASQELLQEVTRIQTGDEIEALAADFTCMAEQLIRHQHGLEAEIAAKTQELRNDLEMAKELQLAFLPHEYPEIPSRGEADSLTLNFHHLYQAAMSVSGDFCDVIKLSDHRVGVFIADVMGHGTRSALVTAVLRTLLHGLAKEVSDPAWFLTELNQQFRAAMQPTDQFIFVTACYMVIDTQERTVWCASAGHPSPLCSNRISGTTDLFFDSLKHNPALGLIADAAYTPYTRRLRKGDVFLMFTDGVTEAMNDQDDQYGLTRLIHSMRAYQNQSLSVLTHEVFKSVREFTGHPHLLDDLCLVAIEATANQTTNAPVALTLDPHSNQT